MAVTSVLLDDAKYSITSGANSFSKSAIGHAALTEVLSEVGYDIIKSQANTERKLLGAETSLFLLEPKDTQTIQEHIEAVSYYSPTLFVLPKRLGIPDPTNPSWIINSSLIKQGKVQKIARQILPDTELIRPETPPQEWHNTIALEGSPRIDGVQLIKSERLEPVIWNEAGILLGKYIIDSDDYDDWPIWILSDPDILQNHALDEGWNLDFTVAIISNVTDGANTIIVDEIIHGFTMDPSLARAMFSTPFIYATLASLLTIIVFMAATTRRFGAPAHKTTSLQDSKSVFLDNTARILRLAEHERAALIKLIDDGGLQVSEILHAPENIGQASLTTWLDAQGHARDCSVAFSTIRKRAHNVPVDDPDQRGRIIIIAQQFHHWRKTILSGSAIKKEKE